MKRANLFLLLIYASILISCRVNTEEYIPQPVELEGNVVRDIIYKTTPYENLLLDLYLPETSYIQKSPVIIFIHGGAWTFGDKSMIETYYRQFILKELLNQNFAVASINYSLLNDSIHFPQPIIDCKDAVRWIKSKAQHYFLDTNNIGLWGSSAGGHLALLSAYYPDEKLQGDSSLQAYSSSVNYVIDQFAPTDLNKLFRTRLGKLNFLKWVAPEVYEIRTSSILNITACDIRSKKSEVKQKFQEYSPVKYISDKSLPTLIMHGDKDDIVSIKQTKMLIKQLKKNNANYVYKKYHGLNHGFKNAHEEDITIITRDFMEFIHAQQPRYKEQIH